MRRDLVEAAGSARDLTHQRVLANRWLVTIFVGLVICVPVLVLGEISDAAARERARQEVLESGAATAEQATSIVERDLNRTHDLMLVRASGDARDAAQMRNSQEAWNIAFGYSASQLEGGLPVSRVGLTDAKGNLIAEVTGRQRRTAADTTGVFPGEAAFAGRMEPRAAELASPGGGTEIGPDISGPYLATLSGEASPVPTLWLGRAIFPTDSSRLVIGVIFAELPLDQLSRDLQTVIGPAEEVYLVDTTGKLVARAGAPLAGDALRDLGGQEIVATLVRRTPLVAIRAPEPFRGEAADPLTGAQRLFASAYIPGVRWHVLVAPRTTILDDVQSSLTQLRAARFALIALLLAVGFILSSALGTVTRQRVLLARTNTGLGESLERQTATAEVLKAMSRTALDLRSVLERVIEHVTRLCRAQQGFIYLRGADGLYRLGVSHGITPEFKSWTEEHPIDPVGRGTVMGRVVQERRTVSVPDVLADPDYEYWDAQRLGNFRALLGVPLFREGEVIGVVILWRTEPVAFADEEVGLVETFADQAAIAMENARLFGALREKNRELEVASRHKSEFLANMSHELRTPLNAINGFSQVLLERMFGAVNAKQEEYLRDILGSGTHLLSLINDILDLSKIEAGRMELETSTFSLADALANALTLVRERAARQRIAISLSVEPGLDRINADERKLKQVLVNLLSNAVKFTPDGGRVELRAAQRGDELEVSVHDTGIGVPADEQERIFEEFHQAASARGREGTGLGLTLAKKFVELHGGRISVESRVGEGSTFTFTLPLRAPVASAVRT